MQVILGPPGRTWAVSRGAGASIAKDQFAVEYGLQELRLFRDDLPFGGDVTRGIGLDCNLPAVDAHRDSADHLEMRAVQRIGDPEQGGEFYDDRLVGGAQRGKFLVLRRRR